MSPDSSSENVLNVNRKETIYTASSEHEERVAIRRADWARIKRNIENLERNKPPKLSIWYSILFGVSGSSGISIIPIVKTHGLPAWVTPLYVCVCFFSSLLGSVLIILERKLKTRTKSDKDEILTDMAEIEKGFPQKREK
jgi:hypothetical protein